MKLGYIYTGPRTDSERRQRKAVIDAGASAEHIHVDKAPDRTERDEMIERGIRPGDVVVIASPAYLGNRWPDTRAVIEALGIAGVAIQIAGSDPVFYEDHGMVEAFRLAAIDAARRTNGRALAKADRVGGGRKPIWKPSDDDGAALGPLWVNKNVPASVVLSEASRRAGFNVARHQLLYWFGNRNSE